MSTTAGRPPRSRAARESGARPARRPFIPPELAGGDRHGQCPRGPVRLRLPLTPERLPRLASRREVEERGGQDRERRLHLGRPLSQRPPGCTYSSIPGEGVGHGWTTQPRHAEGWPQEGPRQEAGAEDEALTPRASQPSSPRYTPEPGTVYLGPLLVYLGPARAVYPSPPRPCISGSIRDMRHGQGRGARPSCVVWCRPGPCVRWQHHAPTHHAPRALHHHRLCITTYSSCVHAHDDEQHEAMSTSTTSTSSARARSHDHEHAMTNLAKRF